MSDACCYFKLDATIRSLSRLHVSGMQNHDKLKESSDGPQDRRQAIPGHPARFLRFNAPRPVRGAVIPAISSPGCCHTQLSAQARLTRQKAAAETIGLLE